MDYKLGLTFVFHTFMFVFIYSFTFFERAWITKWIIIGLYKQLHMDIENEMMELCYDIVNLCCYWLQKPKKYTYFFSTK